jgi:hypothetical protein
VLSVDMGKSLENVIEQVKTLNQSSDVLGLKININFDKHREIRDLKIFDDLTRY